jgi:Na+/proline symporter
MMAVILIGVLWKKANTKGAIGGIIAGFSIALVVFLDQALHLGLPILSHPIFHSFLHRDLVVLVVAAFTTVVVSQMTSQPAEFKKAVVNVSAELTAPWGGFSDYRNAAFVLFVCTVVLWYLFR